MPRITLADLTAEPTTLDFAGHTYTVQTFTRAVQKKHDAALAKFRESDDTDSDKNIELLAKTIETVFAGEGDAPPLARALVEAWKNDTITVGQLHALFEGAQEAAYARPTSRRSN